MDIHVLNHPLVDHKLTVLHDKNTPSSTFRELVSELVMLEAYEATPPTSKSWTSPSKPRGSDDRQVTIAAPASIIVPVLRAGLGMLDGMTKMIPSAEVGLLGTSATRRTLTQQITYANRLPEDLTGRQCLPDRPDARHHGTLVAATHYLAERGAKDTARRHSATLACSKSAEEVLELVHQVRPMLCAVDEKAQRLRYIVRPQPATPATVCTA